MNKGEARGRPTATASAGEELPPRDGNSRAPPKHRMCLPAGCALEAAAQFRAALADAGLDFLAIQGSRRAKPSAGITR